MTINKHRLSLSAKQIATVLCVVLALVQSHPSRAQTAVPSVRIVAPPTNANLANRQDLIDGVLKRHPVNPRYFTDRSGKLIYLTGSHTWLSVLDGEGPSGKQRPEDNDFLDFISAYGHNFTRLWAMENDGFIFKDTSPTVYLRTGPGVTSDGKPRYDLTRLNPAYFDRLKSRVSAARERGIYVAIVLFGHAGGLQRNSYYKKENNINNIDGDPNADGYAIETRTLQIKKVTAIQDEYVRKVVETLNSFDNVLYEIACESGPETTAWQYHIIDVIRRQESKMPKQHLIGMSSDGGSVKGDDTERLFKSDADFICPGLNSDTSCIYITDPPAARGEKIILVDTDHLWGVGGDSKWVWKSFLRGLQPNYMDPYLEYDSRATLRNTQGMFDSARRAMGQTLAVANRIDLVHMTPHNELASTTYCLADPGRTYLVYLPDRGDVTINLSHTNETLNVQWIKPIDGVVVPGEKVQGGGSRKLSAPFPGDALVYITKQGTLPSLLAEGTPELPARYFQLLESAASIVERRLAEPGATLASIESQPGWSHFPNAILIPAVLFTKSHPANRRYGDARQLQLALRIGDFLAAEQEKGNYSKRHDSDWDTYMWLETYRILENKLGEERRQRWKKALLEELALLEPKLTKCLDYPWYNAPFIITSPNHYAIYASNLLVGGRVFDKPDWVKMSTDVLHRFCVREQAEDGYWGEHSQAGPTTGYDYLTLTQIAVYWEHTQDPEALKALRRSTDFHKYYTYPDGTPVETINDRNRYWEVSMWGHFGFSHWPDGRRYAAFLTSHFPLEGSINGLSSIQSLGRIAQSALYFHDGNTASIPQEQTDYAHSMKIPAGIRKAGPWVITYSGIIAPPVSMNNFFLDRQANLSVFNNKTGLILSGANSKRQPELATLTEVVGSDSIHMPVSSYFNMSEHSDRLALAYNVFFATIDVPKPSEKKLKFEIATTYKYGDAVSELNLQLVMKAGQVLETGAGRKITLGEDRIDWSDAELGGWIRHNGWTMRIPSGMHLTWPVYPFNPYANKPETQLSKAIGRLSTRLKDENQKFQFEIDVE